MKNLKTKNKPLALLMAVLMMLSIFTVLGTATASAADTQTLFLKPNANWLNGNARFAVYLSAGSSSATWVSMTDAGDGYYKASVSTDYTNVIFARMNPATTENSWSNTWNKSAKQTIPTDGNNCFTVDEGQWSGATGVWSQYVVSEPTTLCLKPNANWTSSDARFAVYLSGGTSSATWVSMTSAGDGYYVADIPAGYTSVIFTRMNPATTENSWSNTWNKSAKQTIPTNGNNCFTVDEGQWSGATGEWSTYTVVNTTTLYLVPNANWAKSDARFAVYLSGGTETATWVSMTSAGNGYYTADIPAGYTSATFARMNPATTENSWSNAWNKSAKQTLPTNGNNCFTVDEGQWSGATGEWSEYGDPTEATAVIHFMDDNDREPVVAKVGDTVEYDVYLKLSAPEVQAFAAWTFYNQPVGTKTEKNQQGIIDTTKIPEKCNVLEVKRWLHTILFTI